MIVLAAFPPGFVLAQTLVGPHYRIEGSTFDSGGEQSSSTNYTSRDSIGDVSSDSGSNSTFYKVFGGFVLPAYPGIPNAPTLTNTGGTLYNSLDFVIGACGASADTNNCVSTTYAIAISSDNFATTFYIQADDTLGASPAWQTYANWGSGSGERVVGLSSGTTYKIKVKARYGTDSETGYSLEASATTAAPNLTITFAGVSSGTTIDTETTSITTTANDISYDSLVVSTPKVAAHTVTVTTNASQGYATTLQQDGNLRTTGGGQQISAVSAPNSAPATWPGGITTGAFGYHTTDAVLCTGTAGRFTGDKFAALSTTPEEVACNASPVSGETTTIVYKLEIGGLQANGNYNNVVTYITTAQF